MLGSILSNLLLVLGMSFFAGGLKKVFDDKKTKARDENGPRNPQRLGQNEFSEGGAQK